MAWGAGHRAYDQINKTMNIYPEPEWGESQEAIEKCSSLLLSGPLPFILTGAVIRLLQYHFSDPANIANPLLKGYIWTSSDEGCVPSGTSAGSRILIGPTWSRSGLSVMQRPAITVQRDVVSTENFSLRNETLPSMNTVKGIYEGHKYQVAIRGSHTIYCFGLSGAEAESLAEEVFFRMLHYQTAIKEDLRLGKFSVGNMAETRELADEAKKVFYVSVQLVWAYVYRWSLIPESPLIKRLGLVFTDFKNE